MIERLPNRDVVLWGLGHTHAHVLRMWMTNPIPDTRLTCISNSGIATYSGMLPGVLAGQYRTEQMEIDLVQLTSRAGARLIIDPPTGLDIERRQVLFSSRPPVAYDVLSIGIGSVPDQFGITVNHPRFLPIKPMQSFLHRLTAALSDFTEAGADRNPRFVIAGGGVAGVEVACCLAQRLKRQLGKPGTWSIRIIQGGPELMPGTSRGLRRRVEIELARSGIEVVLNSPVVGVEPDAVVCADGGQFDADFVLWATRAVAPPILSQFRLPTDERGFLLTNDCLQSLGAPDIFVVGDTGTLSDRPTPKAGVMAVRQGPVLWDNLQRFLQGRKLVPFVPQKSFLKLLNLGDGRAIGEYKGISFQGRWVWKLKDHIDVKFMRMYQEPPATMTREGTASPQQADTASSKMRCLGCGGKIGGSLLEAVLPKLAVSASQRVTCGVKEGDDGAIIGLETGTRLVFTTDFFASPFDDAYLSGRVAAIHALTDAYAMGAVPFAALATVAVPEGGRTQQERVLSEVLQGAVAELTKAGVTLAGGHTIEGPRVELGFSILADCGSAEPFLISGARPGDSLVLTKPLGTGVLLAGWRRGLCRAAWWNSLIESMLQPSADWLEIARECAVRGATDVTGFGLIGHLARFVQASQVSAVLHVGRIPLFPGSVELIRQGIRSTLDPSNRDIAVDIDVNETLQVDPRIDLLYDPQTCGGLLLSVPAEHLASLHSRCTALGIAACEIGYLADSPVRIRIDE